MADNNKTKKTKSVSHPAPLLSTVNINNDDVSIYSLMSIYSSVA